MYNVLATCCDQGSSNRSAIKQLCAETTKKKKYEPYFYVNGVKILTLFDVPHLLKSMENAFFKYNIEIGTSIRLPSPNTSEKLFTLIKSGVFK